jgi:hypothetical protein
MRMARVLASSLRIKIMIALGVRPMSPTMLQEELADGQYKLRTIDKNLKELKRDGWVDLAGIRTGGARRGGIEHVYRAIRLPIFDDVMWPALPLAMREMVSWRIFDSLVERLEVAWEARTLDACHDRHFSCTPGLVDQCGWDRIIARVNGFFEFFLKELQEAGLRLIDSGEQPIQVMVALAFFESPKGPFTRVSTNDDRLVEASAAFSKHAFSLCMAKAMIHPLRLMILNELSTRAMSARMFFDEFGGKPIEGLSGEAVTKDAAYRAFRKLKEFDWLVLVDTKSRGRGRRGQEHFYRAVRPPIFACSARSFPESMADSPTGRIFESLVERMGQAIGTRTMDARVYRHFTWTPGGLDRVGWDRTIERVDELFEFVHGELRSAAVRLEESGEQPIPITVALAVVESAVASILVEPGPPFG